MYRTSFLIGLPVALTLFVYAEQIITLVYGVKGFAEAIPILRVFGLVVFFRFAAETFAVMLTTSKRQDVRLAVVVAATLVNYLLNLYLIPRDGPMGAAYASLITSMLVGLGYVVPSRVLFQRWVFSLHVWVPFICTVAMGAVLWNFRTLPIWYTAPIAVSLCLFVSYFVGYSKEDRRLVLARNENGLEIRDKLKRLVT
jgi:O-antigen/teichoic acid export membrane protein